VPDQESKKPAESDLLPKHCDPASYEDKWIKFWEENGVFSRHPTDSPDKFSIVIPPPNVTGSLHMGHGLNNTLQDVLIRFHHLRGVDALWIPGTDHAGIATQNVVEKQLREQGTTRHELGREEFVKRVWEWKKVYHGNITKQLVRLGAALDWTRERFTLDDQCSLAVRTAFKQLFDEGLIYQGKRMINWCPRCTTALSDIEVEAKDIEGAFYHMKYPLDGEDDYIEIATTRPETMLGDSAVAVHPDDGRYKKYHGKYVILPLVERRIPVIADPYVDIEFGTGALKITPAHDPNDFEIGRKHGLDSFVMMDEEGFISEDYPAYAGMDRFAAREKIVEDLKEKGLFIRREPHEHAVGHCQRCSSIVEPYVSNQWFVAMKELAGPAMQAVRDGRTRFVPARWTSVYMDWLENIQDWCISRQLWWGHRIPVWDCADCGARSCEIEDIDACPACGSKNVSQQEDVLDTWFSSGLWPLSTLGWPNDTEDLELYYPTSVLVTGFDIIFFWVARMMFFGLKFGGDVPFRDVLIHGIVRDGEGRKMSKSFGNVIDPLEIIGEHGADTLRFTFLFAGSMGQDVNISEDKLRSGRNFCDKLWNAARFIQITAGDAPGTPLDALDPASLDVKDRWIVSRLHSLAADVASLIEGYDMNEALQRIYAFIWHDFCDWYVELSKAPLYGGDPDRAAAAKVLLNRVLEASLALLHPFMPFITEELWAALPATEGPVVQSGYPSFEWNEDREAMEEMALVQVVTRGVRDLRAKVGRSVSAERRLPVAFRGDPDKIGALMRHRDDIATLSGSDVIDAIPDGAETTSLDIDDVEILIPFGEQTLRDELLRLKEKLLASEPTRPEITVKKKERREDENGKVKTVTIKEKVSFANGLEEEIFRLRKKEESLLADLKKSEGKLSSEKFVARAPAEVVEKEKAKIPEFKEELEQVRKKLDAFAG